MLDYRRETKKIIKNLGLKNSDIASNLGITITTVSRWRNGVVSPRKAQFERLRNLSSGQRILPTGPPNVEALTLLIGELIKKVDRLEITISGSEKKSGPQSRSARQM